MKKPDKIQPWIETPISFFYPTSDDWYPSYGGMQMHHRKEWDPYPGFTSFLCNVRVRVSLYYNPDRVGVYKRSQEDTAGHRGLIRITVSGLDDTVMAREIKLPTSEYETKIKEIRHWCEHLLPNPLTMEWLKAQGFQFE